MSPASDNGFKPFYTKPSNWLDTFIVLVSVINVLLTSAGEALFNAKLLRLLRVVRVVKLFRALKDLQKILSACTSAVIPVCVCVCVCVCVYACARALARACAYVYVYVYL